VSLLSGVLFLSGVISTALVGWQSREDEASSVRSSTLLHITELVLPPTDGPRERVLPGAKHDNNEFLNGSTGTQDRTGPGRDCSPKVQPKGAQSVPERRFSVVRTGI